MTRLTCIGMMASLAVVACESRTEEPASRAPAPVETPREVPPAMVTAGDSNLRTAPDEALPRVCPTNLPGPGMAEFETPGKRSYCIDQTEVTQAQFSEFLAARVPIDGQAHPLCDARKNPDFAPLVVPNSCTGEESQTLCTKEAFDPKARGTEPVTCVDFCDAVAYCAWAGKRLCGSPGQRQRTYGSVFDEASEFKRALVPDASHWHNACSERGNRLKAYASGFDAMKCAGTGKVGSRNECRTLGKSGAAVYDLMGGVAEWQDICTDDGRCRILGGMFGTGPERGSCEQDATTSSGAAAPYIGFRCCVDLAPAPT